MRLLIADDHEVVRRGVRTLLEEKPGWKVCAEASDGAEAIEKALQVLPDIIVLDISMPGVNGLEAARILRRIVPESEIIILSQHESAEMLRQSISAGARGYVVKSSVDRDLVAVIEKVSRRELFSNS